MIEKTNAVVLRTTKYSESSIILKAFTEKFGMRSYLIRGVRKRNSKYSMNFFQALNILEMLVYERENRNLQNIKEIKLQISLTSHSFDIKKTAIASFLNELILHAIKEEEANQKMFDFIYQSIIFLNKSESGFHNFHLWFMIRFARYLGFKTMSNFAPLNSAVFDLQEGKYTDQQLPDAISIQPPYSSFFSALQNDDKYGSDLKLNRKARQVLIHKMLLYYQLHLPNFPTLKSTEVLSELMD